MIMKHILVLVLLTVFALSKQSQFEEAEKPKKVVTCTKYNFYKQKCTLWR